MKKIDKDIHKKFIEIKKLILKKGTAIKKVKLKKGQKLPVELLIQNENSDELYGSIKVIFSKEEIK